MSDTLNRWLGVTRVSPLERIRKYIVLPAFSIDVTWRGYSSIVGEYHYASPNNFSLRDFTAPTNPNFTLCISYVKSNRDVVRYRLWTAAGEVIFGGIPEYDGQLILKNFRLEIWSTSEDATQDEGFRFDTSMKGSVDRRNGVDTILVDPSPLCEGQQSTGDIADEPAQTNCLLWWDFSSGVTGNGVAPNRVSLWEDRIHDAKIVPSASGPTIGVNSLEFAVGDDLGSLFNNTVDNLRAFYVLFKPTVNGQIVKFQDDFGNNLTIFSNDPDLDIDINGNNIEVSGVITNGNWYVVEVLFAQGSGTDDTLNVYDAATGVLLGTSTDTVLAFLHDFIDITVSGGAAAFDLRHIIGYVELLSVSDRQQTLSFLFSQTAGLIPLPMVWGACAAPSANSAADSALGGNSPSDDGSTIISTTQVNNVNGSIAIPNGANSGSVTGLNLSFTPTSVLLTVMAPDGGLILGASVVGEITADGFSYVLTGVTDNANYRLSYEIN